MAVLLQREQRREANATKRRALAAELLANRQGELVPAMTAAQRNLKTEELVLRLALEEEPEP